MGNCVRYETEPMFDTFREAKSKLSKHFEDNIDNLCELLSNGYICLDEWESYNEQMKTLSKVLNRTIRVMRIKMRTFEENL